MKAFLTATFIDSCTTYHSGRTIIKLILPVYPAPKTLKEENHKVEKCFEQNSKDGDRMEALQEEDRQAYQPRTRTKRLGPRI